MSTTDTARAWHALQRVVFPFGLQAGRDELYVRGGSARSRTRLDVAAGERASFATYFAAFPAAYWAAHTDVTGVRLRMRLDESADVIVHRTDQAGTVATLARATVTGEWTFETDISPSDGWLWFEIVATHGPTSVSDAQWEAWDAPRSASATICITTFNREADCVRLLQRLASDPALGDVVDAVVVADQGSRRLAGAAGFDEAAAQWGSRLRLREQPNLGGSGGFSRGMVEALAEESTYALLLDDDVDLEPESVHRMIAFAQRATRQTIVGAQMLSLVDPTRLHSFGERVDRSQFWWGPVDPALADIDLAKTTIDDAPALSQRIDVDFNGWWMCLIPVETIRQIGLSLPYFIKWDDAEFGLRAGARGIPTVTLPGAALWHMPWTAKDDGLDWQAYFQLRNRVVTALLHGGRGGRRTLLASFTQDLNHVLCAQYGSVAVRNLALRDILRGPGHLDPVLRAGPARAAAVIADLGQRVVAEHDLPATVDADGAGAPQGAAAAIARLARVLGHQLRRSHPPQRPPRLARTDGKWWSLGMMDGAVVDAAAGTGAFVLRRSRSTAARETRAAIVLRVRMLWRWRALTRGYRGAAPAAASVAAWHRRFAGSDAPAP